MRWDTVIRAVLAEVRADAVLGSLYTGRVRLAGAGDYRAPLLELTLIADGEGEQWAPVTIQYDQWNDSSDAMRLSERRLRELFHLEAPRAVQGIVMWSEYVDGDVIGAPDRDGRFGRAIRFRHTPLRERYDGRTV